VSRVGANGCKRSVKVDRYALDLGECIGDEVGDIGWRRHSEIDKWVCRVGSSLRIVHHRTAPENATALAEHGAVEVTRSANEGGVAERETVDRNHRRQPG